MSDRCEFISTWVWAPAAEPPQTQSPAAALGLRLPGSGQTSRLPLLREGRHHGGILGWSPGLQHSRRCASPRWDPAPLISVQLYVNIMFYNIGLAGCQKHDFKSCPMSVRCVNIHSADRWLAFKCTGTVILLLYTHYTQLYSHLATSSVQLWRMLMCCLREWGQGASAVRPETTTPPCWIQEPTAAASLTKTQNRIPASQRSVLDRSSS